MGNATYTARSDAVLREIVEPIEASGVVSDAYAEFDISAIADEVLSDYKGGYICLVDHDEFWDAVKRHAR